MLPERLRAWLRRCFGRPEPLPFRRVIVVTPEDGELHCDMDETIVIGDDILIAVIAMAGEGIMLTIETPRHKWPWIPRTVAPKPRNVPPISIL